MSNDSKKRSNLVEILDLLKGEMDKFTAINNEMVDNQADFEKINHNYHTYSNEIDKSGTHISKLKRREFYENLFIYFGFFFFLSCVAFVLLRRFPLHKIIAFLLRLLTKGTTLLFRSTSSLFISNHTSAWTSSINSTNASLINTTSKVTEL